MAEDKNEGTMNRFAVIKKDRITLGSTEKKVFDHMHLFLRHILFKSKKSRKWQQHNAPNGELQVKIVKENSQTIENMRYSKKIRVNSFSTGIFY